MTHDAFQLIGEGFSPYITNQVTQTLEALPQGEFVRNLKGELVFLGAQGSHKYRSTVQGFDPNPPVFGSIFCGQRVIIYSMKRLLEGVCAMRIRLTRFPVPESLFGMNAQGDPVPITLEEEKWVRINNWDPEAGIYLSYCPVLTMLIRGFSLEATEQRDTQKPLWTMTLDEV